MAKQAQAPRLAIVRACHIEGIADSRQTIVRLGEIHVAVGDVDRLTDVDMAFGSSKIPSTISILDINCDIDYLTFRRLNIAGSRIRNSLNVKLISARIRKGKVIWPSRVGCLGVENVPESGGSIRIPAINIAHNIISVQTVRSRGVYRNRGVINSTVFGHRLKVGTNNRCWCSQQQ